MTNASETAVNASATAAKQTWELGCGLLAAYQADTDEMKDFTPPKWEDLTLEQQGAFAMNVLGEQWSICNTVVALCQLISKGVA